MGNLSREDLEARYMMFQTFALDDQRNYYDRTIERHEKAAAGVNTIRATISLLTGLTAAVAGLLTAIYFTTGSSCAEIAIMTAENPERFNCLMLKYTVDIAIVLSVALPALGGFFGTLADLYQWDKQISLYRTANENIEVADARSPLPEMEDEYYLASVKAYAEGTLQVMSDETAQWGQSIRTPRSIESFVEEARLRAIEISAPDFAQGSLAADAAARTADAESDDSDDTDASADTAGNESSSDDDGTSMG
ncbi:MAG: hypothetical protein AAFQ07_07050 [Chloroflexota bacterium]